MGRVNGNLTVLYQILIGLYTGTHANINIIGFFAVAAVILTYLYNRRKGFKKPPPMPFVTEMFTAGRTDTGRFKFYNRSQYFIIGYALNVVWGLKVIYY